MDAAIDKLLAGDLPEVLARCAREFLPDAAAVEERTRDIAQEHPILSMFNVDLHAEDGRRIASVGGLDDDLDGRLVMAMSTELAMVAPLLRMTMDRVVGKLTLTPEHVLSFVQGSVFDPRRKDAVARGLSAYLSGDYVAALCILIPETEAAVRQLAFLAGSAVEKRARRFGGLDLKNLAELLAEPKVKGVLTDRIAIYLRVLLTDRRGWNLRNSISHGMLPPAAMGSEAADRIIHVVLLLGTFRVSVPESK